MKLSSCTMAGPLSAMIFMVLLGGCAPIPHYEVVSPTVAGKVHRNGKPVENAVVYVEHPVGQNCSAASELLTRTDTHGFFQFELQKEFRLFVFMDPAVNWQVCIVDGEKHYQGWYLNGIGGLPREIKLDCNLETDPQDRETGYSITIKGICTSNFKYN